MSSYFLYCNYKIINGNYRKYEKNIDCYLPAGPGDGGDGKPLPSGMPSPEFGAGPGLLPALTVLKAKPINAITTKIIIHFFIFTSMVK